MYLASCAYMPLVVPMMIVFDSAMEPVKDAGSTTKRCHFHSLQKFLQQHLLGNPIRLILQSMQNNLQSNLGNTMHYHGRRTHKM